MMFLTYEKPSGFHPREVHIHKLVPSLGALWAETTFSLRFKRVFISSCILVNGQCYNILWDRVYNIIPMTIPFGRNPRCHGFPQLDFALVFLRWWACDSL